jgi:hypothetical protein
LRFPKSGQIKLAASFASLANRSNLPQIDALFRSNAFGDVMTRHLNQLELARRGRSAHARWNAGDGPGTAPRYYIKLKGRVAYREADVEAYEAERLMESTQLPVRAKLVTT